MFYQASFRIVITIVAREKWYYVSSAFRNASRNSESVDVLFNYVIYFC